MDNGFVVPDRTYEMEAFYGNPYGNVIMNRIKDDVINSQMMI